MASSERCDNIPYPQHNLGLHCTRTRFPKGWPDTVEGLHALKKHAILATLSNGNVRLLIDLVRISSRHVN